MKMSGRSLPTFQKLIALMMEAASTSQTSVNVYQTSRRNNSEVILIILLNLKTHHDNGDNF
jgi:hypothetical protein